MKDLTTYPHLKDFVTSDDKTQLWYKTKGTAKTKTKSDNNNIGRTDAGIMIINNLTIWLPLSIT